MNKEDYPFIIWPVASGVCVVVGIIIGFYPLLIIPQIGLSHLSYLYWFKKNTKEHKLPPSLDDEVEDEKV